LLAAALNDVDVWAADVQNAYLTAPCREKIWLVAGPEFGPDEQGKVMIVRKALYGLKSSGAAFRVYLADTLYELGFRASKADPDVWLRPAIKPDGAKYYEYVLCYVDDLLSISHKAVDVLKEVARTFKLKNDSIEVPDMYLGCELSKMAIDGLEGWCLSSEKYCKSAIQNMEEELAKTNQREPKLRSPLATDRKMMLLLNSRLMA